MNRRQLEYAVRLAKVRSFSKLSEEVGISQPALSKQIGALEQELGVKLFDRSTSPLTVTPAGAHFAEKAAHLVFECDQLRHTLGRFQSGEAGRLTVGVSPFRCQYLMPRIIKALRETFPHVEVVLHEDDSAALRRDVADGKFDFAILNLPIDDSILDAVPMEPETVMLAVPSALADSIPSQPCGAYREVTFADCAQLPFVTVGVGQEMRLTFDKICAAADVQPTVAAQVKSLSAALDMVSAGVGATVLPLPFLQEAMSEKAVALFTIRDCTYTRQPAVVTRRGQYLSEYARYAIRLLTK